MRQIESVTTAQHGLVGLARVSTDAQDLQLQIDALTDAGCARIFEEKVSSRSTERPGLTAALDYLRPGDTLCVWKLDRLGRSVKDVLTIAEDLHERGIGAKILIGTLAGNYHPTGDSKFFFTMMAAFSELERHMIHQRTTAGLEAVRARAAAAEDPLLWTTTSSLQLAPITPTGKPLPRSQKRSTSHAPRSTGTSTSKQPDCVSRPKCPAPQRESRDKSR